MPHSAGGLRPGGGGHVPTGHPEHLADEAIRGPVRQPDLAAWPTNSQELGGRLLLVGGEHGPEGGEDDVEAGVGEGNVLGIALGEGDLQPLGGGALPPALQQCRDVVDGGDLAEAAGGGQRRVAVSSGHVEDPLAGSRVHRLAELLGHDDEGRADDRVVAGRPRLLLLPLDRRQVGRGRRDGGFFDGLRRVVRRRRENFRHGDSLLASLRSTLKVRWPGLELGASSGTEGAAGWAALLVRRGGLEVEDLV